MLTFIHLLDTCFLSTLVQCSLSPRGDYVISHLELTSQPSLILTILGSHESLDTPLFAAKETSRRLRIAFKYEYIHGDLEDSLILCQFV